MPTVASELLRPGLLEGVSLLVVGPAGPPGGPPVQPYGQAVREVCEGLGARAHSYARDPAAGEAAMDAAVASAAAEASGADALSGPDTPRGPGMSGGLDKPGGADGPAGGDTPDGADAPAAIDMLVVDGAALFARGGLHECLDGAWDATRAVVNLAFLPARSNPPAHFNPSTGRIVYIAPAPDAGKQADAARAGLENLARTLSVEWARHEITPVTIALGNATTPGEVAALCAYLASPAGAYFSGCQLDLRGV